MQHILENVRRLLQNSEHYSEPIYGSVGPSQIKADSESLATKIVEKTEEFEEKFRERFEKSQEPQEPIRIKVGEKIGSGGYGFIHVLQSDSNKVVKFVRQSGKKTFCQEAAINVVLGNHDLGVTAFEDEFQYGTLYIEFKIGLVQRFDGGVMVLERYDDDLTKYFKRVFENDTTLQITFLNKKLSENIDKLFSHGITCSDIKPENVLIKYDANKQFIKKVRISDYDSKFCCLHEIFFQTHPEKRDIFPGCTFDKELIEIAKNATKMQLSVTTYLHATFGGSLLGTLWKKLDSDQSDKLYYHIGPTLYDAFTEKFGEETTWPKLLFLKDVPSFVGTFPEITNRMIFKSKETFFRAKTIAPVILIEATRKFFDEIAIGIGCEIQNITGTTDKVVGEDNKNWKLAGGGMVEKNKVDIEWKWRGAIILNTLEKMNVLKTFSHYVLNDNGKPLYTYKSEELIPALARFMEEIYENIQYQDSLRRRQILQKWQRLHERTQKNVNKFILNLQLLANSKSKATDTSYGEVAEQVLLTIASRVKERRRDKR